MDTSLEKPHDDGRGEYLELYKLALDDYRFQVQLNQSRSQYFLVLNIGIISIASGLISMASGPYSALIALIYIAGALFCAFSIVALRVQRKFYKSARDQKSRFEGILELQEASITPVQRGNKVWSFVTFKNMVDMMLGSMAFLNLIGAGYIFLF